MVQKMLVELLLAVAMCSEAIVENVHGVESLGDDHNIRAGYDSRHLLSLKDDWTRAHSIAFLPMGLNSWLHFIKATVTLELRHTPDKN